MLKRAPTVYIPQQPEDDGVALPTLLSIVVHGAIIVFVIFSHRIPDIDSPPPIETSIVTPEELAAMQAAIIDNRNAVKRGSPTNTTDSDATSDNEAATSNDMSVDISANNDDPNTRLAKDTSNRAAPRSEVVDSEQSKSSFTHPSGSIFNRSNKQPDDFELPDTSGYDVNEHLKKKQQNYEQAKRVFQQQIETEMEDEFLEQQQAIEEQDRAEQQHLDELRKKQNAPPIIKKPERVQNTLPPSITNGGNNGNQTKNSNNTNRPAFINAPVGIDMGSVKLSNTMSGSSGRDSKNSQASATSNSNSINSALKSMIESNWTPPKGLKGKTVSTTIRVDSNGNVKSVTADSDNESLNKSIESAVMQASPLTPLSGTGKTVITPTFKVP